MPSYFNISLQFERKDIYGNFMKDFYNILSEAGLQFKSGYRSSEEMSLEEIVEWNQRKLEGNFKLGSAEHYSYDFKQVLFEYGTYSQVRGFWMNRYPDEDTFSFEIVIPESEILVEEEKRIFQRDKMDGLLYLSRQIWQFPYVRTIQTGLEAAEEATGLADLLNGAKPNVTLFSIVEKSYHCFDDADYQIEKIDRDGIVLKR